MSLIQSKMQIRVSSSESEGIKLLPTESSSSLKSVKTVLEEKIPLTPQRFLTTSDFKQQKRLEIVIHTPPIKVRLEDGSFCSKTVCTFLDTKSLAYFSKVAQKPNQVAKQEFEKRLKTYQPFLEEVSKEHERCFSEAARRLIRVSDVCEEKCIAEVSSFVKICVNLDSKAESIYSERSRRFKRNYQREYYLSNCSVVIAGIGGLEFLASGLAISAHVEDVNILYGLWGSGGGLLLAPLWEWMFHKADNLGRRCLDGWPQPPVEPSAILNQLQDSKRSVSWRLHAIESIKAGTKSL